MNLDLQVTYPHWTGRVGQVREDPVTGNARPTGLVQVFAKSVASIVVDRISLLPFNPTYDANLRGDYRLGNAAFIEGRLQRSRNPDPSGFCATSYLAKNSVSLCAVHFLLT